LGRSHDGNRHRVARRRPPLSGDGVSGSGPRSSERSTEPGHGAVVDKFDGEKSVPYDGRRSRRSARRARGGSMPVSVTPMVGYARAWILLLVAALLVSPGCVRSPDAQKTRQLERGDRYAGQEKYREAVVEYRKVLRLDPDNQRAHRQLGLVYFHLRDLVQAERHLLRARDLDPNDLEARLTLGDVLILSRRPDEARKAAAVLPAE